MAMDEHPALTGMPVTHIQRPVAYSVDSQFHHLTGSVHNSPSAVDKLCVDSKSYY